MNLNKNLCEKLYLDVKNKLQHIFVAKGMTYRGSETSIWKLENTKTNKTYFQEFLEEKTQISFSTTFNYMYLWRKRNEVQQKEMVHFQEDYLYIFIKFLNYSNPQEYINAFSLTLHHFFGIQNEGKIIVVQPIFDTNKSTIDATGRFPLANEQTVDSRDTECLLELINLFHDYNQMLPKRLYDQEIVQIKKDNYELNETILKQHKTTCIFSIGFYSNSFFSWVLAHHAYPYIEYIENPVRFRVRYFHETLQASLWTDYYQSNEQFDVGFLMKLSIKFSHETIPCYFFCGIENKGTRAITSYLCQNWKIIQQKYDSERTIPINDAPFLMIFKINKANLQEIYCEKVVKLNFS